MVHPVTQFSDWCVRPGQEGGHRHAPRRRRRQGVPPRLDQDPASPPQGVSRAVRRDKTSAAKTSAKRDRGTPPKRSREAGSAQKRANKAAHGNDPPAAPPRGRARGEPRPRGGSAGAEGARARRRPTRPNAEQGLTGGRQEHSEASTARPRTRSRGRLARAQCRRIYHPARQ